MEQQDAALKFRYDNNFDNFIQQIVKSPTMTEEFSKVFTQRLGMLAESGIQGSFAQEISKFLSMIEMSPADMLEYLKTQNQSAVKFQGIFFDLLRQAMNESGSVELTAAILDFLKKYANMTEGDHLLNSMSNLLQTMKGKMFAKSQEELQSMIDQMNFGAAKGDVKANADILKNKLLPFLNEYIKGTHDRGGMRESAAQLATLTARYANGDEARLQAAFMRLMSSPAFAGTMQNADAAALMRILSNTDFERASRKNKAMLHLADIIKRGAEGEAGIENKGVFRQLMQSFLLNESVYMPVLHMTLPMNVDGAMLFSEMWIDPDAEGGAQKEDGTRERVVKGLVKFDIEDVGFFDLFFLYSQEDGGTISMQISYPEELKSQEKAIRNSLEQIIVRNHMKSEQIVLGAGAPPIPLSEAFPKIVEGRNTINVSI